HCDQHRPPDGSFTWIYGVGQPGVRGPDPPERREDQQAAPEPAPRRILREHRRDLREREDEDEVEEQLERRDPLLTLGVQFAHGRTLPRYPCRSYHLAVRVDEHLVAVVETRETPTAVIAERTSWERFPALWRVLLDEVWSFVRNAGVDAGRNVM